MQRCERLVGVARQFEVYCAGCHGPRRTGILGLIQIPDAMDNLDYAILSCLISTIDHPGSCAGDGRAVAPFVGILLGGKYCRTLGIIQRCRLAESGSASLPSGEARHCRSIFLQINRFSREAQQSSRIHLRRSGRRRCEGCMDNG